MSHWFLRISRGGGSSVSLGTSTSVWPLLQEESVFLCWGEISSDSVNFSLLLSCHWLPPLCFPCLVLTHMDQILCISHSYGSCQHISPACWGLFLDGSTTLWCISHFPSAMLSAQVSCFVCKDKTFVTVAEIVNTDSPEGLRQLTAAELLVFRIAGCQL